MLHASSFRRDVALSPCIRMFSSARVSLLPDDCRPQRNHRHESEEGRTEGNHDLSPSSSPMTYERSFTWREKPPRSTERDATRTDLPSLCLREVHAESSSLSCCYRRRHQPLELNCDDYLSWHVNLPVWFCSVQSFRPWKWEISCSGRSSHRRRSLCCRGGGGGDLSL